MNLNDTQRNQLQACGLFTIDEDDLAAWSEATQPCDTCGGDGHMHWSDGTRMISLCPDCVGGRRVVTLTATCPTKGQVGHQWWNCSCAGSAVTLGRFTILALLPIRPELDIYADDAYVWRSERTMTLHVINPDPEDEDSDSFTLDPLPRPGQFIARPERVE